MHCIKFEITFTVAVMHTQSPNTKEDSLQNFNGAVPPLKLIPVLQLSAKGWKKRLKSTKITSTSNLDQRNVCDPEKTSHFLCSVHVEISPNDLWIQINGVVMETSMHAVVQPSRTTSS